MDVPNNRRRYLLLSAVCLSLAACGLEVGDGGTHAAGEVTSGLAPGETVGLFQVVKVGGVEDGVPVGEELCYRWRLGSRPVVMVFAREPDDALASLVMQIDEVVAENQEMRMASFVNFMGPDADSVKMAAAQFGEKHGIENVALVVPVDHDNGPENMKIDPDARVTVMIYRNAKVEANHVVGEGGLDDATMAKILADTNKILN